MLLSREGMRRETISGDTGATSGLAFQFVDASRRGFEMHIPPGCVENQSIDRLPEGR